MQKNLLEEYQRLQTGESTRAVAYLRLRRALQNLMDAGVLRPGQALPSERDLAQLLDLSRVTIRKALAGLIESGLLVQRQGAGTFVAERILRQFSRLTSFTDDLRERGLNPQVKFLERSVGEVTPEESMALNLSPGSGVVRMYRLRHVDGAPIAIERTLVPYLLLPDPDQWRGPEPRRSARGPQQGPARESGSLRCRRTPRTGWQSPAEARRGAQAASSARALAACRHR